MLYVGRALSCLEWCCMYEVPDEQRKCSTLHVLQSMQSYLLMACYHLDGSPSHIGLHSSFLREAVFDELVSEVQSPEEGEPLQHLDVQELASDLFGLGAKPETLFRNRTTLYEVSSALERAAAKRQKALAKANGTWAGPEAGRFA